MTDNLDDIFSTNLDGSTGELSHISDLVAQARASAGLIALWEEKLVKEKSALKVLLEATIPEAMTEVGMSEITLVDGTKVKVEPFHHGSITEKTKARAHKWLEDNGFGGLIKRDITVSFAKDAEGYGELLHQLQADGFTPKEKESVHVQTLGAFIRNQAEKGEPVPQDLFNVYSGQSTKLVKP